MVGSPGNGIEFKREYSDLGHIESLRGLVNPLDTERRGCNLPLVIFKLILKQLSHYCDVIMNTIASQITSLTIVYLTVNSGTDQRKHQSSASLAFVREIHRRPVNSPHKRPVTRKMFPFDDVIMLWDCLQAKATRLYRWLVNINPGNRVAQSMCNGSLWRHQVTMCYCRHLESLKNQCLKELRFCSRHVELMQIIGRNNSE